jgi:hypothetical protein
VKALSHPQMLEGASVKQPPAVYLQYFFLTPDNHNKKKNTHFPLLSWVGWFSKIQTLRLNLLS